jgi:hypothetical protein
LNRKIYAQPDNTDNSRAKSLAKKPSDSTSTFKSDSAKTKEAVNLEKLQSDYKTNVIGKLDTVKEILSTMAPLNYKLEILENLYSLIYLSSHDLKEPLEDEDDEDEEDIVDDGQPADLGRRQSDGKGSNEANEMSAFDNDGYDIINEFSTSGNNNMLKPAVSATTKISGGSVKRNSRDIQEGDLSIYEIENQIRLKRNSDAGARSAKSALGSYCSFASISGSSRYHHSGTCDEDDDENNAYGPRRNKLNLYRRNAGGGGPFLINDFLCRDLLIVLKDLLNVYTTLKRPEQSGDSVAIVPFNSLACSITTASDLSARSSKLIQLVNESLWRFQLIRNDAIKIEYGQIITMSSVNADGDEKVTAAITSEIEQNIVYELLKTSRKRANSSSSLYSSLNESFKNVRYFS